MADFKTPQRKGTKAPPDVNVPASPFMKKLGYGTGVSVYKMERSPICDKIRSPWAVKKINKGKSNINLSRRLEVEAAILRKLNHPNIVGFRACAKDVDGKLCLVMEECCSSLGDMIERRYEDDSGPFSPSTILKVAFDISKAMNYLHNEAFILHCDIKSYNVLVKGNFDVCKLCDFGVSLPLNANGKVAYEYYINEGYKGTLSWTAPEIIESENITDKSDVYSYGLVLWEMLALMPPPMPADDDISFEDSYCNEGTSTEDSIVVSTYEKLEMVGSRPQLPSQTLGDEFNYVLELFHCCTEVNPDDRPKSSDLVLIVEDMMKTTK